VDFDDKSYSEASYIDGYGQLFETFIKGEAGSALYNELNESKRSYKEARLKIKECTTSVNEAKTIIDELQRDIEARKASRIGNFIYIRFSLHINITFTILH
jgi:hypothetical protein